MALKDQLVAHWSLEEASGGRADDIGSNTLTDNNTVTQNPGLVGNAAQFTAANTEYLSIVDNTALSMGDIDFAIAFWVYLDSKGADRGLVAKWSATEGEYRIYYTSGSDRFRFDIRQPDNAASVAVVANIFGSPSIATWYFIHAWHDSVANTINIQVNNGTPNTTAVSVGVRDSTAAFEIGRHASGQPHNGRIDQVGVWKRTLTSTERSTLYNGGAGLAFSQFSGTYTLTESGTAQGATGSGAGLAATPPVFTASGAASAAAATGAGTGLAITAPVYSVGGSATANDATGSGAGLAMTPPLFSLAGTAAATAATGAGAGLAVLAPIFSLSGSVPAQDTTAEGAGLQVSAPIYTFQGAGAAASAAGSGSGLAFLSPVYSLVGAATAEQALGSGAGLLWIPDIIPAKTFAARARTLACAASERPVAFTGAVR
jgi:hypothetical protein